MNKNLVSVICAISCSFLWGTAFIAQDMGMDYIGPFSFSAGRMFLGFIALIPFFLFFEFKKIKEKKISFNTALIYLALLGLGVMTLLNVPLNFVRVCRPGSA